MFVKLVDAIQILKQGKVVGIPTETVYGLAGRFDSEEAIKLIFTTKQRPFFDPLIVHVSSLQQARILCSEWSLAAEALAKQFWPGPLTFILPKSEKVNALITSGLNTVGIRMPDHELARQLIDGVGVPLAAPSANLFGHTSPTKAAHVEIEFQGKVSVLDGGDCLIGIESTVVFLQSQGARFEFAVLREGKILKSELIECLAKAKLDFVELKRLNSSQSPGHLKHHYMPSVPLIYCRQIPRCEEHLRSAIEIQAKKIPEQVEGVKINRPQKFEKLLELSLSADPVVAARELYSKLRETSDSHPDVIYFVEPQAFRQGAQIEQWSAVRDRLTKASSLILDEELA